MMIVPGDWNLLDTDQKKKNESHPISSSCLSLMIQIPCIMLDWSRFYHWIKLFINVKHKTLLFVLQIHSTASPEADWRASSCFVNQIVLKVLQNESRQQQETLEILHSEVRQSTLSSDSYGVSYLFWKYSCLMCPQIVLFHSCIWTVVQESSSIHSESQHSNVHIDQILHLITFILVWIMFCYVTILINIVVLCI